MKIVIIGGSGLIGSRLVPKLREQGHEAVAASPKSGVNTITGEGLAEALKGASVVVDISNAPSWEDAAVMKLFETSTRNLLAHEAAAGVGHHVALSVVGSERMLGSGYFRAKIAQENLIKGSAIPYSIVRATQFFEFVKGITDFSTEGNKVRLPSGLIQPMAADDVAGAVARIATGSPINGTVEIGGPELTTAWIDVTPSFREATPPVVRTAIPAGVAIRVSYCPFIEIRFERTSRSETRELALLVSQLDLYTLQVQLHATTSKERIA